MLDDGTTTLAIVVVDSLGVPRYVIDEAKRVAAEHTGIAADRILISATHTHSATSALGDRWSPADYDLAPTLDDYQRSSPRASPTASAARSTTCSRRRSPGAGRT